MTRLAAAAVLVPLLLAGCAASRDRGDPPASPFDAAAWSGSWSHAGCREIVAAFDVPSDALAALLPPGFTPGDGMTPGRTTAGIDAFQCEDGGYASFWANAVPPADLVGDAEATFVKWDTLVLDPAVHEALEALGAPARDGDVSISEPLAPAAGGAAATVRLEGVGDVTLALAPGAAFPGQAESRTRLREFTATEDGRLLLWSATLLAGPGTLSPGSAQVPEGSVPAILAGATTIPCLMGIRSGALEDAVVSLVPAQGEPL